MSEPPTAIERIRPTQMSWGSSQQIHGCALGPWLNTEPRHPIAIRRRRCHAAAVASGHSRPRPISKKESAEIEANPTIGDLTARSCIPLNIRMPPHPLPTPDVHIANCASTAKRKNHRKVTKSSLQTYISMPSPAIKTHAPCVSACLAGQGGSNHRCCSGSPRRGPHSWTAHGQSLSSSNALYAHQMPYMKESLRPSVRFSAPSMNGC